MTNTEKINKGVIVLKVYKDKQYLVFDFENNKTVKYDFAKKVSIGKSGNIVKDLKSQLVGFTLDDLFDCCEDPNYAKFLRYIREREDNKISNIGTILERSDRYSKFEQFFSAGIDNIDTSHLSYKINDVPKGLIKICREHNLTLSDILIDNYKDNPDIYHIPYTMKFESLDDDDIRWIIQRKTWDMRKTRYCSMYLKFATEYDYNAKALLKYFDYCKTFEALEIQNTWTNLWDYTSMMSRISQKYDKYPRHLLTSHQIAVRNYKRLKQQFDEELFKARIDTSMEKSFDDYIFIYPKSTQEIKDEAAAQNNCVASYIQRVIDGGCHILFLRKKKFPNESLITIEVNNSGRIVQAKRRFNDPVTKSQQEIINRWNEWYAAKRSKP